MNLKYYIVEDIKSLTLSNRKLSFIKLLFFIFFSYKARIIIRMRLSQFFQVRGFFGRKIALLLYWANLRRSVDISPKCIIGYGLRLAHPIGIVIGDKVRIGNYCAILQNVTIGGNFDKIEYIGNLKLEMPYIGNFVEISPGATILGPIKIDDYSIIGANSVVIKNVEENEVVGGIPAKTIKKFDEPHSHGLLGIFINKSI